MNLQLPPLRDRRADMEDLVAYFLEYYNRKYNCRATPLSSELMTVLQKYHWPGNIRELENLVKRYVILGNEEVITSNLVTREPEYFNPDLNFDGPISLKKFTRQAVRDLERKVILKVLAEPSLESQASGASVEHQLPRAALQDPRSRIAPESFFTPAH